MRKRVCTLSEIFASYDWFSLSNHFSRKLIIICKTQLLDWFLQFFWLKNLHYCKGKFIKKNKKTFKLNFLIISVKSALRAPAYDGSLFYYNLRSLLKFLFLKSGYWCIRTMTMLSKFCSCEIHLYHNFFK